MCRTSTIPARILGVLGLLAVGCPAVLAAAAVLRIRAVDGAWLTPFNPAGAAGVVFFVSADCPISNSYAPEIQRMCAAYRHRGAACSLIYEDLPADPSAVARHLAAFDYHGIPAAIDRDRSIARVARASVTPEAVVVDATAAIRYRGRIDNKYAAFGKPRQQITTHDLANALDAVLGGRPVSVQETQALGCAIPFVDVSRR